jgi:hypothetical protein
MFVIYFNLSALRMNQSCFVNSSVYSRTGETLYHRAVKRHYPAVTKSNEDCACMGLKEAKHQP